MPWVYKYYTEEDDGKGGSQPIMAENIKGKMVPSAYVEWLLARGTNHPSKNNPREIGIRNSYFPLITRGKNKGTIRQSIWGALPEGQILNANSLEEAIELRKKHRAALRAGRADPINLGRKKKAPKPKVSNKSKDKRTKELLSGRKGKSKSGDVPSKSWSKMSDEEKLRHAKKVLTIENPSAMTAFKNSKMRNRDKNAVILNKYNDLSDSIKRKHLA